MLNQFHFLLFPLISTLAGVAKCIHQCVPYCLMQVDHNVDHFSSPEGEPGKPETNYNNRPHSFMVMSPCRSCQVCKQYSLLPCAIFVSHFIYLQILYPCMIIEPFAKSTKYELIQISSLLECFLIYIHREEYLHIPWYILGGQDLMSMKLDEKPSFLRCTWIWVYSGVCEISYIIIHSKFDLRTANPCVSDFVAGLLQGARVKPGWMEMIWL